MPETIQLGQPATMNAWGGGAPGTPARQAHQLEQDRFNLSDQMLGSAFMTTNAVLGQGIDSKLLFSQAADAVGAKAGQNMSNLRRSLGGRGINPNSGAATGMLSRLAMEQEGQITGATRDIAIENQRQRSVAAAQNFNNVLNYANFKTNGPVGQVLIDEDQNNREFILAKDALRMQQASQEAANKTNLLSSLIGAGGSILAGVI